MHLESGDDGNSLVMEISSPLMKILTRHEGSEAQEAEESKEIVPPPLPLAHKAEHYEAHQGHNRRDEKQGER